MSFKPRVHGNGFIQVDLTPAVRLHIWGHPDIPHQQVPTPIHDHAFGFTSRVLMGRFINASYGVEGEHPDAVYQVYQPRLREGEDTVLLPTAKRVDLLELRQDVYRTGDIYHMEPGQIHQTIPLEPSVTILAKGAHTLDHRSRLPRVFVPYWLTPDNDFNRYAVPEEKLMAIVADVLLRGNLTNTKV